MSAILAMMAKAAIQSTDPRLARMAVLYDEVCLKAFPDEAAVDRTMAAKGATPLTAEQVRVTLVNDPGRGWRMLDADRDVFVFLELPPYRACSVRWSAPGGPVDLAPYRQVAEAYRKARPGFETAAPYDADIEDIHVHATGEQRSLPGSVVESLFIFEQTINDPARQAKGETGIVRRFVHQFAPPE